MEPSRNDFVGKTYRYETIGIDPLIGKNLWDNVAVSSPCIGQYKLTCLQTKQSSSRLRALSSPLSNPSGSCWSILLGDCLVCNLFSLCSCVGCVGLLLRGLRYNSPCGCVVLLFRGLCYIVLVGLRCVTLSWAVLHCPSWLFCVAPSWAVLPCPSRLFCVAPSWAVLPCPFEAVL